MPLLSPLSPPHPLETYYLTHFLSQMSKFSDEAVRLRILLTHSILSPIFCGLHSFHIQILQFRHGKFQGLSQLSRSVTMWVRLGDPGHVTELL